MLLGSWNMKCALLLIYFLVEFYGANALKEYDDSFDQITVNLTDYDPKNHSSPQIFDVKTLLYPKRKLIINVSDIFNDNIEFFVIQVHSYISGIVLSSSPKFTKNKSVIGTNTGLVQIVSNNEDMYTFYIKNQNETINATFLNIIIVPYNSAPIPGGCNMEFPTEIAPYQRLMYTDDIIKVDAQAASFKGILCESQIVKHDFYHLYLPERDYSSQTYFDYINKMMTVSDILTHGTKVSRSSTNYLRHLYSSYIGTGSVYAIIANINGSKSAYVPVLSYGCDISNSADNCDGISDGVTQFFYVLLISMGLFVCFFGHRFFSVEVFLLGTLVSGYGTFLIFTLFESIAESDKILISIGIGCLFGLSCVCIWSHFGIPILSTLLTFLVLGYLIGAVVFYAGLGDVVIAHNDIMYWGIFITIILVCIMILIPFGHNTNILACCLIGSYAFVLPLDHHYGGNIRYIFINTIRRVSVENFGTAIIDAPYQWKDTVLTVLWLGLAFSGLVFQCRKQLGRPPFPPSGPLTVPPPSMTDFAGVPNERTPLMSKVHLIFIENE